MTTFKDRPWSSRFDQLGDEAEARFETVCTDVLKLGYVRYGLNRPPLQMSQLPTRLRYTPDYLMSGKLIEVQGFGRDQVAKIKLDKLGALHWWNDVHPVELFLWDSKNERWAFVTLKQVDAEIASGRCELCAFPEGKAYFALDGQALFDVAVERLSDAA